MLNEDIVWLYVAHSPYKKKNNQDKLFTVHTKQYSLKGKFKQFVLDIFIFQMAICLLSFLLLQERCKTTCTTVLNLLSGQSSRSTRTGTHWMKQQTVFGTCVVVQPRFWNLNISVHFAHFRRCTEAFLGVPMV